MAARKPEKKPIEQYDHKGKKRVNNPPVGLVDAQTDKDTAKKEYAYDPHLDPQLVWAGKAEHTSFEVPTVSLHVHERIDPPYGIKYGSNFQPFANKRDVKEGMDEDKEIGISKRINFDYAEEAKEFEWRFFILGNRYVSK